LLANVADAAYQLSETRFAEGLLNKIGPSLHSIAQTTMHPLCTWLRIAKTPLSLSTVIYEYGGRITDS
jgi:hypothetical protein